MTKNFSEKAINSILDLVSAGSDSQALLSEFYETTLKTLEEAKNDRLVFKTNCKLCKLWFDTRDFVRMAKALRVLRASCTNEDGSDDQRKGTQLLEVFALEIQMHTEQKHNKKLKQLYTQALAVKSAIPHPRIMGIIRECGGKMRMSERTWADAATDFFEVRGFLANHGSFPHFAGVTHAGVQVVRRGWRGTPHPVPQVPRAGHDAHEFRGEPV